MNSFIEEFYYGNTPRRREAPSRTKRCSEITDIIRMYPVYHEMDISHFIDDTRILKSPTPRLQIVLKSCSIILVFEKVISAFLPQVRAGRSILRKS